MKDFKSIIIETGYLNTQLNNVELFRSLVENEQLTRSDLKYVLNKIKEYNELWKIIYHNKILTKELLKKEAFDAKNITKFNKLLEDCRWPEDHFVSNIFEMIEVCATYRWNEGWTKCSEKDIDQELLRLNDFNKWKYLLNNSELTQNQKTEIANILLNSEIAQNRLKEIIDSHLIDNYNYDELKHYLTKTEKKNLFNV